MEETIRERVEKALEELRPQLQADGGDIELLGVDRGVVKVRLKGACARMELDKSSYEWLQALAAITSLICPFILFLGKYLLVHKPNLVRESMRGTSIKGPMTVARAAPEPMPKMVVATAIATSK